jgi:hypothetical protein
MRRRGDSERGPVHRREGLILVESAVRQTPKICDCVVHKPVISLMSGVSPFRHFVSDNADTVAAFFGTAFISARTHSTRFSPFGAGLNERYRPASRRSKMADYDTCAGLLAHQTR